MSFAFARFADPQERQRRTLGDDALHLLDPSIRVASLHQYLRKFDDLDHGLSVHTSSEPIASPLTGERLEVGEPCGCGNGGAPFTEHGVTGGQGEGGAEWDDTGSNRRWAHTECGRPGGRNSRGYVLHLPNCWASVGSPHFVQEAGEFKIMDSKGLDTATFTSRLTLSIGTSRTLFAV